MGDAVLVTGAGGFVGSAVVRRLARVLASGDPLRLGSGERVREVVALLRPGGSRERLAEVEGGVRVVEADLLEGPDVEASVRAVRPVAVVHAALDRAVYQDASTALLESRVATPLRTLVGALGHAGGRRFVHTGSAWVLPPGASLDEATPRRPSTPYARAKALEDRLLPGLAAAAGVDWVNLRLFNLFGRYERPDRLIPYLVERLGSGRPADLSVPDNVRDFTDVELAGHAFVLALTRDVATTDPLYHIGTGRGTSIAEMAGLVADVVGGHDLIRFRRAETTDAGMDIQVADIGRARKHLGWDPPDDLPERVRAVARWWSGQLSEHGGSPTTSGRTDR